MAFFGSFPISKKRGNTIFDWLHDLRCSLVEYRDQAFESIYQKAVMRESPEISTKISKGEQSFVESVKAWFKSRQDWLIVFDGVSIETDADVTDLATFVPDSQNSRYGQRALHGFGRNPPANASSVSSTFLDNATLSRSNASCDHTPSEYRC